MDDSSNGSLQLVLAQVLQSQQAVATDISAMRSELGKVSVHLERVDTRNEVADKLHVDHEARLRTLEKIDLADYNDLKARVAALDRFRWVMAGVFSVLQVIAYWLLWNISNVHHH